MLGVLAVLAVLAAMAVVAARSLETALGIAIFLLPWDGLVVDIGVQITAYQVTIAAILGVLLIRSTQPGAALPAIAAAPILLALALWAIGWSLLQLAFFPETRVITTGLRGPLVRAVIQIILFLFAIAPVLLVPLVVRSNDTLLRLGRLYTAGVVVLGIIGWLELAVWYATGTNPIPIGAVGNALGGDYSGARSGAFALDALNIYRMNSFCYEPRTLGIATIIAMTVIQGHALVARRSIGYTSTARGGWHLALVWVFLFVTMLATFSTSALGLWVIASMALLPACWLFGVKVQRSPVQLLTVAAGFIIPFLLLVAGLEAVGVPIVNILAERTIERLGSDGAVEDFDLAILDYLATAPMSVLTGVGLGNIHLYADRFLDPLFALYGEGNVFVAKSQYLRFISEIGIIGLGLFLAWYLALVIAVRRVIGATGALATAVPLAGGLIVIGMGTLVAASTVYAFGGAMTAICAIARREAVPASGGRPAARRQPA